MSEKKMWIQDELTCKPLDTYEEILSFIENPPSWRSLCKEISPHSEDMIKNIDIINTVTPTLLESPLSFCHFNPETESIKRQDKKNLPKTLVCHDMANGYHDDSFIDGTGKYDAYTFYNWAGVDVFCYFSHHLVTIPPLGWINVGHQHGVKVIGTIITEWAEGVAFWDNILESEEKWQHFASALVAIAKTLKFDGWLLNVENKISKPAVLLQFVQQLHRVLHQELEAPLLLWYDSVTTDGHLHWQNGLTDKNMKFFEATDGLFTNYSWTVEDVRRSAAAAGARLTDLYVGVDVWGRNMHGGGQFNTQQAIQVAHSFGCSLAIFAPAWTQEAMAEGAVDMSSDSEELSSYEQFLLRDRALWTSIWPYLNTKLPCELPFQTSFCRGQGKKRRWYGEVISPAPWFNLRHMQYQPNSSLGPHGYVLSTQDNINRISKSGLLSHRDGIQNYRRVIEASKNDASTETGGPHTSKTVSIATDMDENENKQKHGEWSDVKQKVKTTLLSFFKQKTSSNEEHAESSANAVDESDSLVQMSVTIRLGDKKEKVRYSLAYVPNELECLEPFYEDSFNGGSCLKVNPRDEVSELHRFARIFHCEFHCEELIACVVTKKMVGHNDQFLNILLHLGDERQIVLVGRKVPRGSSSERTGQNVYPTDEVDSSFRVLQKYLLLNEPSFYVPVQNSFGWKVRYYKVELGANARVSTISCRTGLDEGPILLGHFGLCHGPRAEECVPVTNRL